MNFLNTFFFKSGRVCHIICSNPKIQTGLRVPWTARRSNQSILKEISPGISLEEMMLKEKLQYFGHLMRKVDSLEKTDAGRDWGEEEKGTTENEMAEWHHWLNGLESEWTPEMVMNREWTGSSGMLRFIGSQRVGHDWATELNWTECLFWTHLLSWSSWESYWSFFISSHAKQVNEYLQIFFF